jgi:N6-L-threonylcarbamoyladenine synthase
MLVLGIETTCDETAAAVVYRGSDGLGEIRSNVVLSQTAEHQAYGGVVPEIASRAHVELLDGAIRKAMKESELKFSDLDAVAAAAGPGLIGGVIVGLTTAKAIALVIDKPLLAVNHLEGHALTVRLTDRLAFPYLLLLISGGHTQLVSVEDVGRYSYIGGTVDDAIGEAFDKTAKMLGLPYPGGPEVERCAKHGDPERFNLPRPMRGRPVPNFSLSGLKTAVRLEAERIAPLSEDDVADLCASFQAAIVDIVVDRVRVALLRLKEGAWRPRALVVAGGVAVNRAIYAALDRLAAETATPLVVPPPELCTDNGAMIAWAGAERLARGLIEGLEASPRARWPLQSAPATA